MGILRMLAVLALLPWTFAHADQAGRFDYYVLSLSWSPTWCETTGDARNSDQCDVRHDHGFILHGLWPQYETGWPDYCRTFFPDPSRAQTNAMADIMGTSGLARHQWKKHGRCSGLPSEGYFALSRAAYRGITRPEILRKLGREVSLPPKVVEDAFLEANPALSPDMITVTCERDLIDEVRICLTKDLTPRVCGADVLRDCSRTSARLPAIR